MINIQNATGFIVQSGNEVEKSRLRFILTGERPERKLVEGFFATQRADGSWSPFWEPGYSSLDATCYRLAQATQMGLDVSLPAFAHAVEFLVSHQQMDGHWAEDASVAASAPPWAQPGDLAATLYLTANCGYWTANSNEHKAQAARAAQFLQSHLAANGQLPTFLHAHWLSAGLLLCVNQTESVERILAHLGTQTTHLSAQNCSWLLTTLLDAGLATNHALMANVAEQLLTQQRADGGWSSDDDPSQDVHVAIEALRALKLLAR